MNKKVVLIKHINQFWNTADIEIYVNDKLTETVNVNKFYDINPDWIIIYDTVGGSGTGWNKGNIIRKIYIGDAEFETK